MLSNAQRGIGRRSTLTLASLLFVASTMQASTPITVPSSTLPYQGVATEANGRPVADGSYPATFSLFGSATMGTNLWTETQSVSTSKGLFSTSLGLVKAIPDSLFGGSALYLGVSFNGGGEGPRSLLGTTPWAKAAGKAATSGYADSSGKSGALDSLKTIVLLQAQAITALQTALMDLRRSDSTRIVRDSNLLVALSGNLGNLNAILKGVSRANNTLHFDSLNLNVRNGLGQTDAVNGLGNLVIGYNALRGDTSPTTRTLHDRPPTFSHSGSDWMESQSVTTRNGPFP